MSLSESERVQNILEEKARGDEASETLRFDPRTKTIRAFKDDDPDERTLSIEPSDMKHFYQGRSGDCDRR